MKKYIISLGIGLALIFTACGDEGSGDGTNVDTRKVIDSGVWQSALNSSTLGRPYNSESILYFYNLSCSHSGYYQGTFTIYDDWSAKVQRTDGSIENCLTLNIFDKLTSSDRNDINATKWNSGVSSSDLYGTTWYDATTKLYYDTESYSANSHKMIAIVSFANEALIQDSGGTQTIRFNKEYIELEKK